MRDEGMRDRGSSLRGFCDLLLSCACTLPLLPSSPPLPAVRASRDGFHTRTIATARPSNSSEKATAQSRKRLTGVPSQPRAGWSWT